MKLVYRVVRRLRARASLVACCLLLVLSGTLARADTLNVLGSSGSFAIFGAAAVTNTGTSTISGDIGSNTAISGLPPGLDSSGTIHLSDAVELQAGVDALSAFNALALLPGDDLTGEDLGGKILTAGTYSYSSSAQLTGVLTLDFEGLDNESIVIQTGSILTTASGSVVQLLNMGTNDTVYWEVGSSATLGTTTSFAGDILAADSITLNTGASISCGSAMALTGAVTMDDNTVSSCGTPATLGPAVTATPEPSSLLLLSTGATAVFAARRKLLRAM